MRWVSIPFIAGQWSLQERARQEGGRRWFQSPSLRGSGRFLTAPLAARRGRARFQSPSLRGSGRFRQAPRSRKRGSTCFNPLHCGAVVASSARTPIVRASCCFNPLHCGAVVASPHDGCPPCPSAMFQSPSLRGSGRFKRAQERAQREIEVSIPFIAGQWSLPKAEVEARREAEEFQSPSLRGSGRFSRNTNNNRFPAAPVSIPFIAGQWSLPPLAARRGRARREFQSPSLRGSGRFQPGPRGQAPCGSKFQSPSLRGSGRFAR